MEQQIKISNFDLRQNINKYSMKDIMTNLEHLDLKILVNTQRLTAEFCVKYIMNDNYVTCTEDQYLFCNDYVLSKQTHLIQKDLNNANVQNQ